MKIRYQSQLTGKLYDSEKQLKEAEAALEASKKKEAEKKQKRADAAKVVNDKLSAAIDAQKEAQKALSDFCKEYGTFKTSLTKDSMFNNWDLFDILFNF